MVDLVNRPRVLPATTLSVPIALSEVDGRLDDIEMRSLVEVKDAAKAASGFLPYLGWEASVDVYDAAWPEDVRRAVIAAAPIVHRYKGTRYAVAVALKSLRLDAEIAEWWQTSPRGAPYTFQVRAYARARLYDGPLLDDRLINAAYMAVLSAKPVSRAFEFRVGAAFADTAGLAPALTARIAVRTGVEPRSNTGTSASLGLALALAARQRAAAGVEPQPHTGTCTGLALASAFAARTRLAHAVAPVLPI